MHAPRHRAACLLHRVAAIREERVLHATNSKIKHMQNCVHTALACAGCQIPSQIIQLPYLC